MIKTVDIGSAAELLGKTARHVRRMCEAGKLPGAKREGGRWRIPTTAHYKLAGYTRPEDLTDRLQLDDIPVKKRQDALARLGVIKECERFCAESVHNGSGRDEAMTVFCVQKNIAKRSLQRWIRNYRTRGLAGLIDTRGGAFKSEKISAEAWEYFKGLYLNPQQLTIKMCWQNTCFVNKTENKGWRVPRLRSMRQYVKDDIPMPVAVLHREGMAAYDAKCAPFVMTDPDSIEPGAVWVGDHHQFNCWVRYRGKWVRPWITAWQDMRSRTVVGHYISASPNQTTIMIAMKRAIEKHGPPESVKIDNGKDYDSQMWTGQTKTQRRALSKGYIDTENVAGIYAMMGVAVSFAIPYHPQSKQIERWFDTLDTQFTKTITTYCGKDSDRKPDALNDMLKSEKVTQSAHTLDTFAELTGQYIEVFNNTAHTGRGMNNKSPNEVLARRVSRRVTADGVMELLMMVWSGELTVGKNGVKFKGLWFGQYDTELMKYQGKKVRLAYDPDDIQTAYICEANTYRLITIAEQAQLIRYGAAVDESSLREAMAKKTRAKRIVKQYRHAAKTVNTDLASLTIAAMADSQRPEPAEKQKSIRPAATVMDKQIKRHRQMKNTRAVRKAAGAEGTREVIDLQLDYDRTETNGPERIGLGLNFETASEGNDFLDLKIFENE